MFFRDQLGSGKNVCEGPAAYGACVFSHFSHVQLFVSLWTVAHQAPLSKDFPGKNTGMGCHALLQGSSWPRDWTWVSCTAGSFFTAELPHKPSSLWQHRLYGKLGLWWGAKVAVLCSGLPNQYKAGFYFSLMEPTAENSQPVFYSGSECVSTTLAIFASL